VIGTMMSGKAEGRYPNDEALLNALNGLQRSSTKKPLPRIPAKAVGISVMLVVLAGAVYGGWQWLDERNKLEQAILAEEKAKAQELARAEAARLAEQQTKKADEEAWNTAKNVNKLAAYQAYLSQFPAGLHEADAKRLAEQLSPVQIKTPRGLGRCEIRPGCTFFYAWPEYYLCPTNISIVRGSCSNGLFDGVLKSNLRGKEPGNSSRHGNLLWQIFRRGEPGSDLEIYKSSIFGKYTVAFHSQLSIKSKVRTVSGNCIGNTATERANRCKELANIFGVAAFELPDESH